MQREAVVAGDCAEGSVKGTLEEKGDMKTKPSGVGLDRGLSYHVHVSSQPFASS